MTSHGTIFLFVEWDWDQGAPFGTAIPLAEIPEVPPEGDDELLKWLHAQEAKHRAEIDGAVYVFTRNGSSWERSVCCIALDTCVSEESFEAEADSEVAHPE